MIAAAWQYVLAVGVIGLGLCTVATILDAACRCGDAIDIYRKEKNL